MTHVQQLARFVDRATLDQMSPQALEQLKIRVLDTLGVAIGAQDAEPMTAIRQLLEDLGGTEQATMIGGGKLPADRVAFYNSALSRYLDFMDSYLAKGETNHPSDNMGAVLAAAETAEASGADFLTAFAVAYQVHTRLSDAAPVRDRGFDHSTQGTFAAAAAAAKALGLKEEQIAHAAAMTGTANVALRVTRTGSLSNWKGLAYPHVAKEGTFYALLAGRGITGPEEVFEGNKGFQESVAGIRGPEEVADDESPVREEVSGGLNLDWSTEDLESVARTIIKKHNAEIHSQSALDAAQELRERAEFDSARIADIRLKTFDVAYNIIGGGEEGDKRTVRTKEEADHSLPWMLAVVLIDGELNPAQYAPERIVADDVQDLMHKIVISPDEGFSDRFPAEMPAELTVVLDDGTELTVEKSAYEGFHTRPLDWAGARAKFDALVAPFADTGLRDEIADTVHRLDRIDTITTLTGLLAKVSRTRSN